MYCFFRPHKALSSFSAPWFFAVVDSIDLLDDQNKINFDTMHIHPDYYKYLGKETYTNGDMALLHTPQNITKLFPAAKIAKLPQPFQEFIGEATVAGFGKTSKFPGAENQFLHFLKLYITDRSFCTERFDEDFKPETMICAGNKVIGKETCHGDSGGGLMMKDRSKNDVLIGILSYGENDHCGSHHRNTFEVYSKVSVYVDWIRQYIDL